MEFDDKYNSKHNLSDIPEEENESSSSSYETETNAGKFTSPSEDQKGRRNPNNNLDTQTKRAKKGKDIIRY